MYYANRSNDTYILQIRTYVLKDTA